MSNSAVCALFEGHYHFGLGALINSLHASQFKGTIWVGYRGDLPPWASDAMFHNGYHEIKLPACLVRFIKLTTEIHLTNYKAAFMLDIWSRWDVEAEAIFYFDPDIVVKCAWWFIEQWAKNGVALCQDVNWAMPANHPVRLRWLELAQKNELSCNRQLDVYFNAGFIGVNKKYKQTIQICQLLIDYADKLGFSQSSINVSDNAYDFFRTMDQDILNLTAMLTLDPLSTIGPDGMDFVPGGYLLSHAIGTPKPWRKPFIKLALSGFAPSISDKLYLQHSRSPICLYSDAEYKQRLISLRIAAAIGRFIRRS